MISPGGIAHINGRLRSRRPNELRADAQRPASARCLRRAHAPRAARAVGGAEHQLFHGLVELRATGGRHVGLGRLGLEYGLLRPTHTLENRCVAVQISKHADAQVDFLRRRIGAELGHQAQNGIRVQAVEMLEQVS